MTDRTALGAATTAVQNELASIDRACSRFRADSELSAVNREAGRNMRIGDLLGEALELALRAAELTDGDVDPTVGSALVMTSGERQSGPAQVVLARRICGWRNVMLDRRRATLRIPAGTTIDLGATAKAWAADRSARAAAQTGGCGALVSVGGDIAVAGPPPRPGWMVHVTDDHRSDHRAPGQTVRIRSGGLATSSTTVRRWQKEGVEMNHIVDPRTGEPIRGSWRTVSVAAASCVDANIATTAALVRAGAAPAWLTRTGVPARLVGTNGRVYTIGAWPAERDTEPEELETRPGRETGPRRKTGPEQGAG